MLSRNSTPPSGPRNSSPAPRRGGISRGGIQKRRAGPTRVDKDGDMVMDAIGGESRGGRGGRGRPEGSSRGRASARANHGGGISRGTSQNAIIRGLESRQANILESRISHGTSGDRGRKTDASPSQRLRVHGLKDSKAASNPDGGLGDLLAFLERKAVTLHSDKNKEVRIKKVCYLVKTAGSFETAIATLDSQCLRGQPRVVKMLTDSTICAFGSPVVYDRHQGQNALLTSTSQYWRVRM
jgi:nuclear RNA export factor